MIGVFDSGVGGLAVLREVRALLPDADLLYLADQAYAPYGERPLEAVRERAELIAGHLITAGASTVVVACNTASAVALQHLRSLHPEVPIVGMVPAVKPAAAGTSNGIVGVLATPATFQTTVVADLVERFAAGVRVIDRPCPGLAGLVEDGGADLAAVTAHVAPLVEAGADTLVIGCTHYSFVAGLIGEAAGPAVTVIDPAPAIARQVARVALSPGENGTTRFATTGDPERFAAQIRRLLAAEPASVVQATV
jgi:glutamate racemase